jgi:hypothetical protein
MSANRDADLKGRYGNRIGGLMSRFADEPQAIPSVGHRRRWCGAPRQGALGSPGLDRAERSPRAGNKEQYRPHPHRSRRVRRRRQPLRGDDQVVDRGGFFKVDWRLTVGRYDKSNLADNMEWQVKAVIGALTEAAVDPLPPIQAVLCFVDGNWPLFRQPRAYNGVLLESDRSLARILAATGELDASAIERVARAISAGLPSKVDGHGTGVHPLHAADREALRGLPVPLQHANRVVQDDRTEDPEDEKAEGVQ